MNKNRCFFEFAKFAGINLRFGRKKDNKRVDQ
jgi:hypothetical protein